MKKKTIWELHRMTVEECRKAEKLPLVMVLDNVRSLSNIGAIFRTCDAFRVASVMLCGVSGTPPSVEIHKTALGAEDSVPWMHFDSTLEAVAHLRGLGYRICVLEQVEGSVPLQEFSVEPGQAYAIIAGHEGEGCRSGSGRCSRLLYRDTTVRLKAFAECVGQRGNHPLASLQSYAVLRDYLKFILLFTLLLRVLSASFCLFFGHVATATLPHHKQKSIRQSFSKSVSYKFRQSLIMPILHLNKLLKYPGYDNRI